MFDLDKRIISHTLVEVAVGILLSELEFSDVGFKLSRLKGGEEVIGVNDDDLPTDLTETERSDRSCLQSVRLDCSVGEDEVVEFLEVCINLQLDQS